MFLMEKVSIYSLWEKDMKEAFKTEEKMDLESILDKDKITILIYIFFLKDIII